MYSLLRNSEKTRNFSKKSTTEWYKHFEIIHKNHINSYLKLTSNKGASEFCGVFSIFRGQK